MLWKMIAVVHYFNRQHSFRNHVIFSVLLCICPPVTSAQYFTLQSYLNLANRLYCRCAELTEQRGYTHFGLQFYGECWSGPNATERFGIQGVSGRCIGGDYGSCVDSAETECIGKDSTNYIYQLFKENRE